MTVFAFNREYLRGYLVQNVQHSHYFGRSRGKGREVAHPGEAVFLWDNMLEVGAYMISGFSFRVGAR